MTRIAWHRIPDPDMERWDADDAPATIRRRSPHLPYVAEVGSGEHGGTFAADTFDQARAWAEERLRRRAGETRRRLVEHAARCAAESIDLLVAAGSREGRADANGGLGAAAWSMARAVDGMLRFLHPAGPLPAPRGSWVSYVDGLEGRRP